MGYDNEEIILASVLNKNFGLAKPPKILSASEFGAVEGEMWYSGTNDVRNKKRFVSNEFRRCDDCGKTFLRQYWFSQDYDEALSYTRNSLDTANVIAVKPLPSLKIMEAKDFYNAIGELERQGVPYRIRCAYTPLFYGFDGYKNSSGHMILSRRKNLCISDEKWVK